MSIEVVSVADAVAGELRRRLLCGQYPGGTELRDTELSAEFGAARPTVRAAVQELVADGLLERGRGRSARVRSFTATDAVDLYRLRRPLELAAVRLVIEDGAALGGIEHAAEALAALPDQATWDVVAGHDIAFHRSVLAASGSPRLLHAFNAAGRELLLLIAQLRPAYRGASELAAEHLGLLDALQAGGLQAVTSAWQQHLDSGEQFFLDLMKERSR